MATPPSPRAWLEERRGDLLRLLETLVNHDSPSTDKAAVDRLGIFLQEELRAAGARVEVHRRAQAGDHLLATWDAARGGGGRLYPTDRPVLLLAHMDTVWDVGEAARRPFRVEGGRAYGPGVFDMKAGIAQAIWAMRAVRERGGPPRPVWLLVTSDEETGSHTSRGLIEELARRSACVLVLEPAIGPEGRLKTWRKGVGSYRLRVYGREAHAGADPERGVSAVEELAHQVLRLRALAAPERGTTVNVGVVRGGTRANVVAGYAEAHVDVRVASAEEAARVDAALRAVAPVLPGARVEVEGGINRPPMERGPQTVRLFGLARELAAELGIALDEGGTGGASDGNFTAALGVPTLDGLGAVGDGAHSPDEHVVVDELPRRAALLARLLEEL